MVLYYSIIIGMITLILLLALTTENSINCIDNIYSKWKFDQFCRLSLVLTGCSRFCLKHSDHYLSCIHSQVHEALYARIDNLVKEPIP
jgi:hypothetical protein